MIALLRFMFQPGNEALAAPSSIALLSASRSAFPTRIIVVSTS
jgi:hypothetical protein